MNMNRIMKEVLLDGDMLLKNSIMDVVIPHNKGSYWKCNELRYCLRSIEKNFTDLDNIYIIGYKPWWVKNVKHIKVGDYYPDNKGACIINKLISTCDRKVSDNFLFVSDDQIFLKKISSKHINTYYLYNLNTSNLRIGNKFWMKCLRNTRDTLRRDFLPRYNYAPYTFLPCYNYEPHTPVKINKSLFKTIMSLYDWKNVLYPTLSLYFNSYITEHYKLPDNYRVFYDKEGADLSLIEGKTFLGYSDLGLSWQLQQKLQELFPSKCKYER